MLICCARSSRNESLKLKLEGRPFSRNYRRSNVKSRNKKCRTVGVESRGPRGGLICPSHVHAINVSPVGKSAFICTYVECALTVSEDSAMDTRRAAREDADGNIHSCHRVYSSHRGCQVRSGDDCHYCARLSRACLTPRHSVRGVTVSQCFDWVQHIVVLA